MSDQTRLVRSSTPLSFVNAKVKERCAVAGWRNWQTQTAQNRPTARSWGFKSLARYQPYLLPRASKPKRLRITMNPLRRRGWHHPVQGNTVPDAGKKRDTCSRPGGKGWNHPYPEWIKVGLGEFARVRVLLRVKTMA